MNLHTNPLSTSSSFFIFLTVNFLSNSASSSRNSVVYIGCSQLKYTLGGPYDSNVNFILASIVKSASASAYNSFNISLPSGDDGSGRSVVYGLFQCRGDLNTGDCHGCVSRAVSRVGNSCAGSAAGAVQLEGCFVRYDDTSFVGIEDKTVISDKCGPPDDINPMTGRDAALADLTAGSSYFRVSGSGKVQGVSQCVEDLSVIDCQDCVVQAIQRLKTECESSDWGDMFLGKCYARYSERGFTAKHRDNGETERTLAMFIGIVAGIGVLIAILTILRNVYGTKAGGNGN